MSCPDCEKSKALGYKFCIKCGENFAETAIVPEHSIDNNSLFGEASLHRMALPAVLVYIIAIIVSIGIVLVEFEPTFQYVETKSIKLFIYLWDSIVLGTLSGSWIQVWWVFITTMALICTGLVLYQSRNAFKIDSENYVSQTKKTPIFWLGLSFGSILCIEIIISLIASACGANVSVPSGLVGLDKEWAVFLFAEAGVNEEIVFRVFWFGIPMMIVALIYRDKHFLRYLWGGFGASKVAVLFLILSSIIFACAHVEGWGLWKLFTVLPGGLIMGYLYMRFGLHASIMFHLINDLMAVWTMESEILGSVLMMLILLTGAICVPLLLKKTWKGMNNFKNLPLTGLEDQEEENNDSSLD